MKKEYISPKAIAIKIQTMGMLAVVSGFNEAIDTETSINNSEEILGREFDMEGINLFEDLEED